MRIVLVPSAFHPSVGGVEQFTLQLARELRRQGHVVEIWTSRRDGDDLDAVGSVDGFRVVRSTFPAPRRAWSAILRFAAAAPLEVLRLRREVQRFHPDVINVHCFSTNGAYATVVSALTRRPLVVSLHGETKMDDSDIFDRSDFQRFMLRRGLTRSTAVTACSGFVLADARERFGLQAGKGEVVFNGVELFDLPEPATVDLPFRRFVFGMGRMVHKKGFDLLLEAWALTAVEHPEVGLVLAGEGPEHTRLLQRVTDLGLGGRVVLPGTLDRGQVGWCMSHADLFVMPSRLEPFGIVVLEAWRAGTPVVASRHGGTPEFVTQDQDGVLVDPLDVPVLATVVSDLLSDASRRRSLGTAGRARVIDFAWSMVASEYVRILGEGSKRA